MDCSKSNNCLPASATCCKLAPNNLASVTASAIVSTFAPKLALIVPVIFPDSSNISLRSNCTPSCLWSS